MTGAQVSAAGATDPGQRPYNEDRFLIAAEGSLFVVADGVGGREAGEIASNLSCEILESRCRAGESLQAAITGAHHSIRELVEKRDAGGEPGMASTVVAVQILDGRFVVAWAGDSRAYFWDGQRLLSLTRDHSLVEALIARGELERSEAKGHPQQNVILSALGGESEEVEIGVNGGALWPSGTFLLCSDGLTDALSHRQICELLATDQPIQARATSLAERARDSGGRDNITALLIDVSSPKDLDTPAEPETVVAPATRLEAATRIEDDAPIESDAIIYESRYQSTDPLTGERQWITETLSDEQPEISRIRSRTAASERAPASGDATTSGQSPDGNPANQQGSPTLLGNRRLLGFAVLAMLVAAAVITKVMGD
ncbi:MAG: serine/threonine protein phosphatase PrpC [Halieaceae bacterium]